MSWMRDARFERGTSGFSRERSLEKMRTTTRSERPSPKIRMRSCSHQRPHVEDTKTYVFSANLHAMDGRWSATCPALPGCTTWGGTKELALTNLQEAAQAYVADMVENGETPPSCVAAFNEPAIAITL